MSLCEAGADFTACKVREVWKSKEVTICMTEERKEEKMEMNGLLSLNFLILLDG